ncbi:hypothetical protein ACI6QG_08080 [Roseococcus sp. DSY-14]|uniref:hypothetical protein n=1 Tax=Roseococcus sp. DSY-14 TaxID=3369650 RepID=UPI00387B246E
MAPPHGQPRHVVLRRAAERAAVLALWPEAAFLSVPGAGAFLGAPGWRALVGEAAWLRAVLDCGRAPGHALAALRLGARGLVLDPAVPGFAALAGLAGEAGCALLPARPPALDLAGVRLDTPRGRAFLRQALGLPDAPELG